MRRLWRQTTPLDRLVILLLAGSALLLWAWLLPVVAGRRVVVERDGQVIYVAPLEVDREVSLEGPLGETLLSIRAGRVCVLDSPCPLKVCMGMGEIAAADELLACVPNRLLIRIEGDRQEEPGAIDALSR